LKKYPGRLVLAAWATIFLLLVLTPSLVSATAYEVSKTRFVYFTPVLIDAHGVIGNNHSYNFQGKWQLITEKFEEEIDYLKNNPDPTATIFHYSGTFLGTAKWDRKTLEVREKVVLIKGQDVYKAKQEYFADRVAVGKCQKDPFLGDGVCLKQSHQWNIPSWNGKSGPIGMGLGGDKFGFLAEKAFDLVEAQQLSQLHHDDPAGAPPSTGTSNRVTSLK
jgi:hypothetical protein